MRDIESGIFRHSAEENLINMIVEDFGKRPAVHWFSDRDIGGGWFPEQICDDAYDKDVIPYQK